MKFNFVVEVEIKNDGITQDAGRDDLVLMLMHSLAQNQLGSLPWVIDQHYGFIDTKE